MIAYSGPIALTKSRDRNVNAAEHGKMTNAADLFECTTLPGKSSRLGRAGSGTSHVYDALVGEPPVPHGAGTDKPGSGQAARVRE